MGFTDAKAQHLIESSAARPIQEFVDFASGNEMEIGVEAPPGETRRFDIFHGETDPPTKLLLNMTVHGEKIIIKLPGAKRFVTVVEVVALRPVGLPS